MPWPQPPEAWSVVMESEDGCRRSVDGSQVLMKWEGDVPAYFLGQTIYGHDQAREIVAGPDWVPPDPPEE